MPSNNPAQRATEISEELEILPAHSVNYSEKAARMSLRDVTLVEMKYAQSAQTISNGSVDACLAMNHNIDQIKELLGSNAVIWPANNQQAAYAVIAGKNDWAGRHPETTTRFLKSLEQAEEYNVNHPTEARAIVQKRLNYAGAYMSSVWPDHHHSLTFDQSLIIAMEDEGRWMIKNNLTAEKRCQISWTTYMKMA